MESSPTPPTERASPQPQTPPQQQPQPQPPSPSVQDDDVQAQEEYLRALLRSQQPPTNQSSQPAAEDPTAKLLSTLLSGGGAGEIPPEVFGGGGGAAGAPPGANQNQNPLGDLSSATGLPPFLTDMLMGQSAAPKTASQLRNEQIIKFLHVLFSVVVGVYLLSLIRSSISLYGSSPPPPAMAQNPFTVFVMGELLLLGGSRVLGGASNGGRGGKLAGAMGAVQLLRGIVRDGGIAIFVIGVGTWWLGGSQV